LPERVDEVLGESKQVKGSFEKAERVELPSKKRGQGVCKEPVLYWLTA